MRYYIARTFSLVFFAVHFFAWLSHRSLGSWKDNEALVKVYAAALSTVKGHHLHIFAKLQAKSRTEAVARELGLL